jgi:class 3 adenylate cyclase
MSASVTATFVFTDLVDSTATAARLGPEAAEALRQTHFRLLRGAATASAGTEVKNLGDGLMVMFTSPSRALACAVGMQQAIEHHNRSGGEPLGVRIGVSAGEAVEEDGDYFGDPVVEAARLCAAATGGQILVADVVRTLVGRHATQTFVDVGPLDLKGLPQPVDAVEVGWEPVVVAGSVPLPGRLVGAATDALFGFFGRGSELAALQDTAKRAHATRRAQVVFVSGEAGMGKTTLVAQVARGAHSEGAVALFGHADEDLGVAYRPWIEALSTLVREGDPEWVTGLRPAQRSALARLIPDVGGDATRVADLDMERLLLFEATSELLAAASQGSPLIVVLDDVHWADAASLQLLRHVTGSPTSMDVTVACTYRETDLGRSDPLTKLLVDLRRETNVTRIALTGLEDVELVELLAAAAGHSLDDSGVGLAHALRRETDGNPFFAAELLRHLVETGGILLGDDGRWTVAGELDELGLPSSVRDVVGQRVERLGDEALRVLCLAAVIGREFDVGLLALLADLDEDPLVDLLDAAVNAAVLVEGEAADRYRFAHALIQHSLYDELSPARRQRTHQRVAEALEAAKPGEDAATLAELAHHWSPQPGPPISTRHLAMFAAPVTRPAMRSRPTTRSAGIYKRSTCWPGTPDPTNTSAPRFLPRSAPPNDLGPAPNTATRCARLPTSLKRSATPTSSSKPRSASHNGERWSSVKTTPSPSSKLRSTAPVPTRHPSVHSSSPHLPALTTCPSNGRPAEIFPAKRSTSPDERATTQRSSTPSTPPTSRWQHPTSSTST